MIELIVAALLLRQAEADIAPATAANDELVGLWSARRWYGPYARGELAFEKTASGWTADFMGDLHPVRATNGELAFELPDGQGAFLARAPQGARDILGHWTPPNSPVHGFRYAAPVVLKSAGSNRWRGTVALREDTFTLYLMVERQPDGSLGAFLRNPERNIGVFLNVERLERDGEIVRLIGKRLGEEREDVLLTGTYDADNAVLSVAFPERGGTYDLRRDDDASSFYPRGKHPGRYSYRAPLARDDGWPTGTLEEANIDRAGIEQFIQMILDMPIESVRTPEVQGVLIARHGKLVLEEYFHGEHRDKLHETRSAAKSLTATLAGAAMQADTRLGLSTPVYRVMHGGQFPASLDDPRKRSMTLEHLLTMRSGYFCDDGNPNAPGNEDKMLEQREEGDYYRYTLRLPLDRRPGAQGVYCSIDPNLALGVVSRATGESTLETFDRLLGAPLKIRTYAWPLDPAGHPYGGGAVQFLPRDFMKLGQLMLNGGTWGGRTILSRDFVARASAPLHDLNGIQYGYLWWNIEYPYKERTVRAYFAGGNGGQGVMVVPELDLVIATYGGNYADRVGLHIQQDFAPNYILPAVREAGDARDAPVIQREFSTPYGRKPPPAN